MGATGPGPPSLTPVPLPTPPLGKGRRAAALLLLRPPAGSPYRTRQYRRRAASRPRARAFVCRNHRFARAQRPLGEGARPAGRQMAAQRLAGTPRRLQKRSSARAASCSRRSPASMTISALRPGGAPRRQLPCLAKVGWGGGRPAGRPAGCRPRAGR